jgi:type I restriction enzyme S subunit
LPPSKSYLRPTVFSSQLLPKFLTYVTASNYGREYFEATGKRTTNLASTNSTKVGEFPIPLPPVKEQEQLVELLDARLDQFRALQRMIESQVDTLTAYRKSLIHECVTGQRRITEADVNEVQSLG